jgi:PAS domain-containing protein
MNSACAWCGSGIAKSESDGNPDHRVSHGICLSCRDNFLAHNGIAFQEYLESIPIPILVIDNSFEILTANRKACEALGKTPAQLHRRLPGEVFECSYARLPEGCGRAIHCSGCAIRKAVIKSFETGEPQSMIPATLKFDDPDDASAVALVITTVKTRDVVILRLDHM